MLRSLSQRFAVSSAARIASTCGRLPAEREMVCTLEKYGTDSKRDLMLSGERSFSVKSSFCRLLLRKRRRCSFGSASWLIPAPARMRCVSVGWIAVA